MHALPLLKAKFHPSQSEIDKRGEYVPVNKEDYLNHADMKKKRLENVRRAAQTSSQPTIETFTTSSNDPVILEDEDDENENKEAEVEPSLTLTSSSYSTMDEGSQPKSTNSSSSSSSSTSTSSSSSTMDECPQPTSTLEHSILGARNQKKNKVIKNNTSTFNFNRSSSNPLDSSLTSSSYSTMDEGSQPTSTNSSSSSSSSTSTNSSSSSSSSTTSTLEHSILGARNQKKNKVIKNNTSTFNFNPSSSNTLDSSSSQVINLVSDETNKRPHATSFSSSSNHSNNNNNNNAENNYEMQCLSPTSSRHSQTKARSALSPVASAPQQNEQKVFLKMFKQSSKSNPPPKRYKKTKSKPPPQKNKLSFRRDSDQFR